MGREHVSSCRGRWRIVYSIKPVPNFPSKLGVGPNIPADPTACNGRVDLVTILDFIADLDGSDDGEPDSFLDDVDFVQLPNGFVIIILFGSYRSSFCDCSLVLRSLIARIVSAIWWHIECTVECQ